jgi:small subunit ribosomal protein S1
MPAPEATTDAEASPPEGAPAAATPEAPPAPPTPANGAGSTADLMIEVDGKLVPNYQATIHPFEEGDVVSGKVVRIDKDEVLVDIGFKSEGVIPSNELSIRKSVDPADEVELGEEVDALVLTKEDQEGRLILSKKRARFEKAWRRIEGAAESGEPVEGTVIEVVKGGLILDLGVRGFLPASLVDIRRVQNLDEFMGTKLECKVIELNRSRNNVVLSRRAVLEEERKEVREQILGRLQPGQVVEGKISNIVDFGAFVDLEGIDGLIHISELSWSHVNHPSEVISIGDTVTVKVLDIDRDRQRISLGLKQTQEDPWQRVLNEYKEGDVVEGKVTKIVAFGAFVQILPGVEGLVHISELAQHHVESPAEVVRPGDELKVQILEVDDSRRRLSLSVKRVEGQELPQRDMSDAPPLDGAPAPAAEAAPAEAPPAEEEAPAEEDAPPAEEDQPPAEEPPAEDAPAAEEPAAEVPAETPAEPADPPAEAPAEESPPAEVPAEDSPPQEAPAEDAPPEEAPAEDAPPEEAPAEES